jgi:hypothetical protein
MEFAMISPELAMDQFSCTASVISKVPLNANELGEERLSR